MMAIFRTCVADSSLPAEADYPTRWTAVPRPNRCGRMCRPCLCWDRANYAAVSRTSSPGPPHISNQHMAESMSRTHMVILS